MWALSLPARQQVQVQVSFYSHSGRRNLCQLGLEIALTFTAPRSAMQNIKNKAPSDRTKRNSARKTSDPLSSKNVFDLDYTDLYLT